MSAGDDPTFRLVLVLVLATAIGPFALQVFLPALPAIQADFAVSAATAQLVFSLSAFSIAVSTLFYGPISDRVGRRPALIGGLVVYLAGSVLCAVAPTISVLIVGRIVQAAGGCAGIVLTRAIVRDLYSLDRSAAVLAYITMAMVAAPMVAPALGGLLTDTAGWRMVFVVGAALGVVIMAAVHRGLPETSQPLAGSAPRNPFTRLRQAAALAGVHGLRPAGGMVDLVVLCLPGRGPLRHDDRDAAAGRRVWLHVRPGLRRVHDRQFRGRTLFGAAGCRPDDRTGQRGLARSARW